MYSDMACRYEYYLIDSRCEKPRGVTANRCGFFGGFKPYRHRTAPRHSLLRPRRTVQAGVCIQAETKHSWFNVNPIFRSYLRWRPDHLLNRTVLLPLNQQGSHHIHAGSDDDKILFAVIRLRLGI